MSFVRALSACALAVAGVSAQANVLVFQGVTFSTSSVGNVLTLEIDAGNPTGDWADAVSMDTIAVKNVGSFDSVSLAGPGGGWTFSPSELNADGCSGGSSTNNACFFSAPVPLTDDMIFTFTYTGGVQDFGAPTLKVRFLDDEGNKEGSLLSMTIPPPIPEPETYALMLAGLGVVGLMARRRRAA
jgi:hypothetical protein